ncbi:UDP-N-acetylmuramoyl-tripeptide--D-alanyl-D-alanine ligase [Spirochaeta africana]|uniref:UDP-N-acetylmuramoyl-tripeptide--D-alanyl-D-alanine ligase n=1 Tax=Spirochaeta africana (strain ATCC 700263 / DSM 8902 / Z-7692) TaxID=889378 RepID=H9UKX6_SPIAZ|nr:UDP-N-acetylmuramoyl-tripeptide--D-alanyl-D-alanine ligase [Spirochaeta africana]AFG38169.1 UDP-N-acetylmuramoyl-tripeptide--D-alanyl-D-alanine ligase [Spirochaeta africana DSM 8902]
MNSVVGVPFTMRTAAACLGGALHPQCDEREIITSVSIDSRAIGQGGLFVPLVGRYADGHDYIQQALDAGALLALAAEDQAERIFGQIGRSYQQRILIVDDPLLALHRLARWYVDRRDRLVKIAVTGSNGKTTTKEILASILECEYPVFKTAGNYNSVIGVPVGVFGLTDEHRYAVFELAMSERGEMAALARIVFPDVAVLTNIGVAHIGNIGSQQGIAEEKKAIFSCFTGRQRAFLPEDEPYYDFLAEGVHGQVVPFGVHHTPGYRAVEDLGLDGLRLRWGDREVVFALPGMHNLSNLLAAVSVAVELGAAPESVLQGIARVQAPFGRGQILRGEVTIIQDCYNANPDSMLAALEFFRAVPATGRKIAVLGDMRELGETAGNEHRRILAEVAGCDRLFLVGEEFLRAAGGSHPDRDMGSSPADIVDELLAYLKPGDLVLLKGSRGVGLEVISERIQHAQQFGGARC